MKKTALFLLIVIASSVIHRQTLTGVDTPNHNDKYSGYVKQLEAGQVEIKYKTFR